MPTVQGGQERNPDHFFTCAVPLAFVQMQSGCRCCCQFCVVVVFHSINNLKRCSIIYFSTVRSDLLFFQKNMFYFALVLLLKS